LIKLQNLLITNFKSIDRFKFRFSKFTCLIGLNSVGKSTVLQSLDFISHQMKGDISQWLKERNWEGKELTNKLTNKKVITIAVGFILMKSFIFGHLILIQR